MYAAAILVALLLLPAISTDTGEGPKMEVFFVPRPPEQGDYTILVYPDYQASSCPRQDAVQQILGPGLDIAFRNHFLSMMRFVGDFGLEYEKLLQLRFERTDDVGKARVKVFVKDLEGNVAGTAAAGDGDVNVELDCDLAFSRWRDVVILHELYHALGLGHVYPPGDLELMGADRIPPPYPSSLDAFALWELWFSGKKYRAGDRITLPPSIPYVVLLPYHVTIEKLDAERKTLESRYEGLSKQYARQTEELYNMTALVASLQNDVRVLRDENRGLRMENEVYSQRVRELESRIAVLEGEAEWLRRALSEREGQVARMAAQVAELQEKLDRAEAWGNTLLYLLMATVPIAIIIPAAIAATRGRGRD